LTKFEIHNLTLHLGSKTLFKQFQFSFAGPGIIAVEGENGAGKSSFLKVCAGFVIPEEGSVSKINDFSFMTTTSMGLLDDLTGNEHIFLIAKAKKIDESLVRKKIEEYKTIDIFNEILEKRVVEFSQGMKQLLRFFLHTLVDVNVMFLDEPFLYLSPRIREFLQQQVLKIACHSIVLITDQNFTWNPGGHFEKIKLGIL
jgi:ABC-2 type transport system ATP-binding protein